MIVVVVVVVVFAGESMAEKRNKFRADPILGDVLGDVGSAGEGVRGDGW